MTLATEYLKLTPPERDDELRRLIGEYNKLRQTYLVVYAAATGKPSPSPELNIEDYKIICDMLREVDSDSLDMYIESPGGSGEVAEEIVRFMRGKFERVSFVVAGEAKSAATILVLSGDEILMADTGSLGPIDAQVRIGRSVVSANDYMRWVNERKDEATKSGVLYPLEATVIAQVSPGELEQVFNALEFAKDLVKDWLPKYKYRDWSETETRKINVTEQMKKERAADIAEELTNTSRWRTHGRSIKRTDLEDIGLRITRVDDDEKLSNIVYRMQMLITLTLSSTPTYKILSTHDNTLNRQAQPVGIPQGALPQPDVVEIDYECKKCKKKTKYYVKFVDNPEIDKDMATKKRKKLPRGSVTCGCGQAFNADKMKADLEKQVGRKAV
jgi:hypothetical protein